DRSRFSPVAALFGYTNLGVIHYKSYARAELEGGIAESWQQVDPTTTVLKVRPNLFWHDTPPVNGRAANAQDIVKFLERNRAGKLLDGTDDPNFYRKALYAKVDSVTAPDNMTVQVKFSSPDPFFLESLCGAYAKVQAPEAVDAFEKDYQNLSADKIIGTGGFVLTEFAAEGSSKLVRHDKFYTDVWLDGIDFVPLFTDQAAQQAAFEQKQLDSFGPTQKAVIDDLDNRLKGKIVDAKYFAANPQAGTYFGGAAPWNNKNLIGAIFKAFDRRAIIQSVLQGQAVLSGNVPPAQQAFTLEEKELVLLEGYREDRAKEETEARQMWEAGGGPALGDVIVDIPDIYEGLYSGVSAVITNQLKKVLGNNFVAKIEPYSTITTKIVQQKYGGSGGANIWFGWISDLQGLDPSQLNYLSYNSQSPQFFQFNVKNDEVDRVTAAAFAEFDQNKRKELSKQFVKLAAQDWGLGIPYTLDGVVTVLTWNYYHYREVAPFVITHMTATGSYIDPSDPTFQGR
ncbi:MAG: ABC transporter substrate-binding protein, partial [Hyphomicrobiales bacterium]